MCRNMKWVRTREQAGNRESGIGNRDTQRSSVLRGRLPISVCRFPAPVIMEGTYVIVAAKTGGHIFPGLALAGEIRSRRPQAPILFVGAGGELEEKLVPQAGFPIERVRASGFVGVEAAGKLRALAGLPVGFLQARRLLERHRARAVAGMGGYVSVPVVAAAASLKIATLVHDSDALPGLASRMLNRFATATAVGLAEANRHLTRPGIVTGT